MKLLLLETSTSLCSAALCEDGVITAYRQSSEPRAHASMTAVYVEELLSERSIRAAGLDAVCLSMGPGSYTGLRVGSSTAKGLCFGAGVPLIAVGTLEVLAAQAISSGQAEGCKYIVPLIDARRMEVYSAVFSAEGRQLTETKPEIVTAESYSDLLAQGPVLFVGDGAGKCKDVITSANARFMQCNPRADAMMVPAMEAYRQKRFKDIAYFEPFYLKDFVATVSERKLF